MFLYIFRLFFLATFLWKGIMHASVFEDKFDQIVLELYKSEKLKSIAFGGSCPDGVIKRFIFRFESLENIPLEECRKQLFRTVNKALHLINTDPKIKPYLHTYPFTHEDIDLIIFYKTSTNNDIDPPNIYIAYFSKGRLMYETSKPEEMRKSAYDCAEEVLRETYKEALEKLKSEEKSD